MTDKELDILVNIIGGVESGGQVYGKRRYDAYAEPYKNSPTEHTVTLGWCQFYGNNARKLCQRIFDVDKNTFRKNDTANIEKRLSQDWVAIKWNPSSSEKAALLKIITTDIGKKVQDEMFKEDMLTFIKDAGTFGITNVGAQMMYCEIRHLGGKSPTERIFKRATKPYTADAIYSSLLLDQKDTSNNNQVGDKKYQSRHQKCVEWIHKYVDGNDEKGVDKMNAINALIAMAENEIDYLEKASNSKLDDKTANAGSGNYTKYWRDVYPQYQGQPWCACFISWCFMKTFGKDVATKLLKHWPYTYCPTMATLFKLNANPKVGDVVIFYRNGEFAHTGLVTSVSGDKFWTIEGNASGASGITPNGGGVVKKSYYNSQLPGTKFCSPDYSIVIKTNTPTLSTSNSSSTSTGSSTTSTSTLLRKGSKGQAVKELQEKLNKLGYGLIVDGDFGSKTESAVISFQKKYKLEIDGIVGNETRNALDSAIKTLTAKPTQPSSSASTSWVGEVNVSAGSTLAVRTWAGTEYPKIKSYPELGRGNRVRVLSSLKAIDGSTWYKITINNAATNNKDIIGFVCGKYIKKVS